MPQQAIVRKIEAFMPISDEERGELLALCPDVCSVGRNRDIVSEGNRPTHIQVILEGWAARYSLNAEGGRRITAFLLPGDFCDIHITSLDVMDHGIVAITDCRVGLVSKEAMDRITRSTPALELAFWRSTLVDAAISRQWLVSSGRRSAYQNIAHLLCELHARLRLIGLADNDRFIMPLTQAEVGDAAGLTPVHVNRMLRDLREQGVIEMTGSSIHIPNVEALRRQAGFNPTYLHLHAHGLAPQH